jgi:hypothetical protein
MIFPPYSSGVRCTPGYTEEDAKWMRVALLSQALGFQEALPD